MIPGFSGFDLIILFVLALLIFGPKRLPEMGSAIGKSIRSFRQGLNEISSTSEAEPQERQQPAMREAAHGAVPDAPPEGLPRETQQNQA